jgi:hypothetical protein
VVFRYGKVFNPINSPFSLFTLGDQKLSQWGLGWGTHGSAFLSPTMEAKEKVPGAEIYHKQNENPKTGVLNIY